MRTIIAVILMTFGLNTFAAQSKEFRFTFEHKPESKLTVRAPKSVMKYEYATLADSWEDAFREAAKACYRHFKDGRKLNENEGLDIIDTCANPRS